MSSGQMMQEQGPRQDLPDRDRRSGLFWGAVMVLIGIVLLASQVFELGAFWAQVGLYIMPALGITFLAWGIYAREPGFLIPGGILTGIGTGILFTAGPWQGMPNADEGGVFLLCMALGFMSITLTTAVFTHETHWWALIPGGIIGLVALAVLFGGIFEWTLVSLNQLWPIALIAGGIYIIYRVYRRQPGT